MSCNVYLNGGAKITLSDDPETVVAALTGGLQYVQLDQPGSRPPLWINVASVLYVEPTSEPRSAGFS